MKIPRKEFERLVERALSAVPAEFRDKLLNVSIEVRRRPGREARGAGPNLLGLCAGPVYGEHAVSVPLEPTRVILYQDAIESLARDGARLRLEIDRTLRHELAHYFGIGEARLRRIWPEGA